MKTANGTAGAPGDELDPELFEVVAETAGYAPSIHNTQPWRFTARGRTLEIRLDPARQLEYVDPTGRQLHISVGGAVEYARLAIRSFGRSCVVRLAPGAPDDPELVATLTVGGKQPTTAEEQRLLDAIPRRQTDRGPYDGRPITAEQFRRVQDALAARGAWVRSLDRPGDRTVAATLLARAEEMEAADPAYVAELAAWRRESGAADGVPVAAAPSWHGLGRVTDVPLRDFSGHEERRHPGAGEPPTVERDTLLLVGSDTDGPAAWVRAGCGLALALLTLTELGLSAQPLGPVTDLPATRSWLQRELGLIGYPQLLLRVGHGSGIPHTGRRPVTDVLTVDGG